MKPYGIAAPPQHDPSAPLDEVGGSAAGSVARIAPDAGPGPAVGSGLKTAPAASRAIGRFRQRSRPHRGLLLAGAVLWGCRGTPLPDSAAPAAENAQSSREPAWIELFNGRDLSGWTPKFSGLPLGVDPGPHFSVRAGLLCVEYAPGQAWDGRFGHLYHEGEFSRYRLRAEYRFVGEQASGGPGWAWRNNGLMLHCQPPATLALGQEFPVSLEAQLLGADLEGERPTLNLCTPGTLVMLGGALERRHCIDSVSRSCRGEGWVAVEIWVDGAERIEHRLDGQSVLAYGQPTLDPADPDAARLLALGFPAVLERGAIAIQAESAPIEFRRIAVQPWP